MDIYGDISDRLLFAIPKKGRLHEKCLQLLKGADIQFHHKPRHDIALVKNFPIALIFLPAADIAKYVSEGNVDMGITGEDIIAETDLSLSENGSSYGKHLRTTTLLKLGFGHCKLQVQVPTKSGVTRPEQLVGKRIATSFQCLAAKFFQNLDEKWLDDGQRQKGVKTDISFISGSVETACSLGLADAIVDLVESGETMKAAGLQAVETLLVSEATLVRSNVGKGCNQMKSCIINTIVDRIQGVVMAQKYVVCNYNVERVHLQKALRITPGRTAPTIMPLEDEKWVAVSAMIESLQIADTMDSLKEAGARDILTFTISNCRA